MKTHSPQRPARPHRYQVPSRAEGAAITKALLRGELTRASVADWAAEYILYDNDQVFPAIDDKYVWELLTSLAGADLRSDGDTFLHNNEDIEAWLKKVNDGQ